MILRPEEEVRQAYIRARQAREEQQAGWASLVHQPSVTRDGTDVSLMLNVGLALELDQMDRTGAGGIGLFRTEIAMLARGAIVDSAEQAALYARGAGRRRGPSRAVPHAGPRR